VVIKQTDAQIILFLLAPQFSAYAHETQGVILEIGRFLVQLPSTRWLSQLAWITLANPYT